MLVASSQTAFCPLSLSPLSDPQLHLRPQTLSPDMAWWCLVTSCCLLGQAGCEAAECNATPQLNFAYCHLMPKLIFYKTRKNILHIPLIIQGWSFSANVRFRNRNFTIVLLSIPLSVKVGSKEIKEEDVIKKTFNIYCSTNINKTCQESTSYIC